MADRQDDELQAPVAGEEEKQPQESDAGQEPAISVDEEWAETLHIEFDPARLRQTPPPVPGQQASVRIPDIPPVESTPLPQASQFNPQASQFNPQSAPSFQGMQGAPMNPGVPYGMNRELPPMPPTYIVPAILITIFCCTIPGIVALIFASKVTGRYMAGDYEGAVKASRDTEIWTIVSFVLGVVSAAIYIPLMMF